MNASAITSEQETGLSLTELMMLPVILLWLTFQAFAQHVVKLKELRRTRPLPSSWREHWPNLRLAEWHIRSLTASGIEQIFSGKELDLHQLVMDPDPPEAFGQMPASALEMHRRLEAIARFHADPERHIRRAAQRIVARDGEIDPLDRADPRPPPPPPPPLVVVVAVMVVVVSPVYSATGSSAQRIRAPPPNPSPEMTIGASSHPSGLASGNALPRPNHCRLPTWPRPAPPSSNSSPAAAWPARALAACSTAPSPTISTR